jgi:dihydrofolate synthase/folylpolyglutamate synthase
MLASLSDPHLAYQVVHIAGTNGKGSTAASVESILREAGHRTGLYTSPHLEDFAERVRVGGRDAEDALLEGCARDVLPLAEAHDATFFEAATVLAFEAFRRSGCETVIAEVGLGGRLDSTNVVSPSVTAITSIDEDHAEYLGDTLELIAAEKAGILKPGVPAVIGELAAGPLEVVLARAEELAVPVDLPGRDFGVEDVRVSLDGTSFRFSSPGHVTGWHLSTPLVGRHQALNAGLAVQAALRLEPALSEAVVARGLEGVRWPGRFELRASAAGTWILDAAHNRAAMLALSGLLSELDIPRPLVVLVAILGDKAWGEMLVPLLSAADGVVFGIAPSSPPARRWDPNEVSRVVGDDRVEVIYEFERAVARARELAGTGTVVVTGSAHTVGDARRWIRDQERHGDEI